MPGDPVDRYLIGVIIAASFVTVLSAGNTIRKWAAAATAAPAPVESTRVASAPAGKTPPRVEPTFGSDTARRLLASVPQGAELDDLRLFWPGPQFALRGHAVPGAESAARLSLWEAQFDGLVAPDGRPYQVWFRRLEGIDSGPQITFEFLLVPEGLAVTL
jgi:hypothetical protein